MIINIKNKKDLITLDLTLKQLRYLKNYFDRGALINPKMDFIPLSSADVEGYIYLYNQDVLEQGTTEQFKGNFLKTIAEHIYDETGKEIKLKDMEILK